MSHSAPPHRRLAPAECPAYILAGGRSSRLGSDKALVAVDGQPLILRLRDRLADQGHAVHVVADRADRYQPLGFECLVDIEVGRGPLGGLAAALQHRADDAAGWILLLSCDLLLWRAEWFTHLAALATPPVQSVVYVGMDERGAAFPQPLPGLYHTELLTDVLERLAARQLALRDAIGAARWRGATCRPEPSRWSFNTDAQLQRLLGELEE